MSLIFNMLYRFVITFLPRSKHLLISWLQSPSAVSLQPEKIQSLTVSIVSPSICHEVMGPVAMILVFWMLSFKPAFSLSSFTFIKRLFSSSLLSAIRVGVIFISEVIDISPGNLDSSLCFFQPSVSHDALCILVPRIWLPGEKSVSSASEAQSLKHWNNREVCSGILWRTTSQKRLKSTYK